MDTQLKVAERKLQAQFSNENVFIVNKLRIRSGACTSFGLVYNMRYVSNGGFYQIFKNSNPDKVVLVRFSGGDALNHLGMFNQEPTEGWGV